MPDQRPRNALESSYIHRIRQNVFLERFMPDSTDDEHTQSAGRLTALLNRHKKLTDKQPLFRGTVHLEGEPRAQDVALWANKTKSGYIILSGETKPSAAARIARMVDDMPEPPKTFAADKQALDRTLEPGAILLFENNDKKTDRSPDYWGYYNPGATHPLMALNIWANIDENNNPRLSGTFKPHQAHQPEPDKQPDPQKNKTLKRSHTPEP